jgi:ATP-dependent RNA helicase RhlE
MNKFDSLQLCPALASNLARLGFEDPTPVQAEAIPPAMAGQDVVATAQTGTGKTLAFALPLLHQILGRKERRGIQSVVLSPTRELAIQIAQAVADLAAGTKIRTAVVVGGLSEQQQLQAIRRGADVVIATPGRLCDFLQRKLVRLESVQHLVLDEADRMLDMGFLPALEQIVRALPHQRQTLFFSATIEPAVAHLIGKYLREPARVSIGATTRTADRVTLHLYEVDQDRKLSLLHKLTEREAGPTLVFSRTKHGAERLAKRLARLGLPATAIHGDRTQGQRNRALEGFRSGQFRVLVATDVAARGIHVDNIAHVVNYDLPQAPEDFIHRVGRTGRAGQSGLASTFATRGERQEVRRIERTIEASLVRMAVPDSLVREERETPLRNAPNVVVLPVKPKGRVVFRSNRNRRRA